MSSKILKICCGTILALAIVIMISVALLFTFVIPRPPEIITHPARLENVTFGVHPSFSLNATLKLTLTVKNPNTGDCWYDSSTVHVYYRGHPVAELPVQNGIVSGKGQNDVVAVAELSGERIVNVPEILDEYNDGKLNFTAVVKMPAKIKVLKLFKLHGHFRIMCDLSVLPSHSFEVLSSCRSKLKF